jgi:hypothetical protein
MSVTRTSDLSDIYHNAFEATNGEIVSQLEAETTRRGHTDGDPVEIHRETERGLSRQSLA